MENLRESKAIEKYYDTMTRIARTQFPLLTKDDVEAAIQYSIQKRYKKENCTIYNDYSNKKVAMDLIQLTDYIMSKKPILTMYGVMFKQKGTVPNPIVKMTKGFMEQRGIYKKEMFKFPKGSEDFEKYNLLQLLSKLDSNALLN